MSAGEGVGRREPSCTVGGMQIGAATVEKSVEALKNTRDKTTTWPSNAPPGHISRETHSSKRHVHPSVHCSTIYNSQDTGATLTSINRWVDKEVVVELSDSGMSLSHKKAVTQSEVSQKEKSKHYLLTHIYEI